MADKKLWEVMDDAFWATALTTQNRNWALCHAAALRALADKSIKAARAADIDQDARNWLYRWLRDAAAEAEGES